MSRRQRKPLTRRERDAEALEKNDRRTRGLFPDEPPKDMDKFRNAMARKIAILIGNRQKSWRGCPERLCRRQRACFAPRIACSNAKPLPPMSPEQSAMAIARVQRALREVMARQGAAE